MKGISLKLPVELDGRLAAAARRARRSRSDLVREAIEQYLAGPARARRGVTCLDLARDLLGSVRGPRDLASHPRHLRGYGR